jgi:pyridoxal phosphate enzyme (YggS family)
MDQQQLSDNITKLLQRVRRSAEKSQFGNSDILALAASKTRPCEDIRAAHACGLDHFGESYLQEALVKITELEDLALTWHFIGPIQSNKTRTIATHFHWVHSVDRAKIAIRLSEQRPSSLPPLQVCVQVNISGEASKSGATLEELPELVTVIEKLPRLQLRGLMAIPAASMDETQQREPFKRMRETLLELQQLAPGLDTLSMGMSGDLDAAIAEGATIVRVGTAIFGARNR